MRDDRIISHVFSRDKVVVKVIIGDFASAGRYNEEELVKIKGDAALPTCRKRKHIFFTALSRRCRSPCETTNDLGWVLDLCFDVG